MTARRPHSSTWRTWGALSLCVALGACSTLKPGPTPSAAGQWQGRMALTVDSQPPERMAAAFQLEGNAQTGTLALFSPLGSTLGQAAWTPAGATLTQGQSVQQFQSLDELLGHFAAAIPVRALFDWLQGQPSDAPGWQVDLSQHANGRISAKREYPQPAVDLRLILN